MFSSTVSWSVRKTYLLFLLIPFNVLSQKVTSYNLERKEVNKWTKAVVNLETQANFLISRLFVEIQIRERNHDNPPSTEYLKTLQDSLFRIRHAGTAIYLLYNKKHYLISARHVLEDTPSYLHPEIYSWIFLRPNGSPLFDNKEIEQDINYTHYLQLSARMKLNEVPFIFSSAKGDLAIISLDDIRPNGLQVINSLNRKGYVPITLSDIDTSGTIHKDDHLLAIGFPDFSEVQYKNLPMSFLHWQSFAVTIPVITKGMVETFTNDTSKTFTGNIFVYHGFSGGPVIRNNKLIGINRAYTRNLVKIDETQMNYYIVESSIFSKARYIMPMLRELERRLSGK